MIYNPKNNLGHGNILAGIEGRLGVVGERLNLKVN
jgi:hypothetical protein